MTTAHNIIIPKYITAEILPGKSGFIFDNHSGSVFSLNKTGSFVFNALQEKLSLHKIIKSLVEHYDVDERVASSDVQDFIYQLKEFNVAEEHD